jgi:predicted N-acetyltransferase YhbS
VLAVVHDDDEASDTTDGAGRSLVDEINNHAGGASRCFVTCRDGRVVGYYALASGAVSHADLSGKFRRNMPTPIPVILLSRLAIDRKHQGRGLGENLLRDAIARCVQVAQQIEVRAILVHALHEEARRYPLPVRIVAYRPATPDAAN